jgi:hypothetical protein
MRPTSVQIVSFGERLNLLERPPVDGLALAMKLFAPDSLAALLTRQTVLEIGPRYPLFPAFILEKIRGFVNLHERPG